MKRWFGRLWGSKSLASPLAQRMADWQALPATDPDADIHATRVVVIDLETSGLDTRRDLLLSIGAVAVEAGRIRVGETYHRIVHQACALGRKNILLHGITPSEIRDGDPLVDTLVDCLAYIGNAPLVAFHAGFDQAVLSRAVNRQLGAVMPNPWLDIAWLLPVLYPEARLEKAGLDAWTAFFGVDFGTRHRADVDALMTAQLWLLAVHRARERAGGHVPWASVATLARQAEAHYRRKEKGL